MGELYAELMQLGATVLGKTVDAIAEGDYPQIPQDHITDIKHAPKIFKETDWNKDLDYVHNFIRGLSPYPAAYTLLEGKVFKIYKATRVMVSTGGAGVLVSMRLMAKPFFVFIAAMELLK